MNALYREEQKVGLVEKYQKLGKRTTLFAAAEGIKVQTFCDWLKRV